MIEYKFKGELSIYTQEGGCSSPAVLINDHSVTEEIEQRLRAEYAEIIENRKPLYAQLDIGELPWELTLRQVR